MTGDPDGWQAERLARAGRTVGEAARGGAAIAGAFVQPAVDGDEWHRGFDARLGLFDRDRNPRPALDALPAAAPRTGPLTPPPGGARALRATGTTEI